MDQKTSGIQDFARHTSGSLELRRFRAITFDCYGTLIDWESGLLAVLRPFLKGHGWNPTDAQIFEIYGELEPAAQHPYRRYRDVLREVMRGFGKRFGFSVTEDEAQSLAASLKSWQPFPDTVAALEQLKSRFQLGIISNTDDHLWAATAQHLRVKFDQVITAEQAGAYKPSLAPFHLALERFAASSGSIPPDQILHAGQSVYHDVVPAKSLGVATVLVHRRGAGATRLAEGHPDLEVPDLKALAALALATP